MNNSVIRIGQMSFNHGYLIVFKTVAEIKCAKCFERIEIGKLVTRAAKKLGSNKFVCGLCRPIEIDRKQMEPDSLYYFITENDWFLSVNGNAIDLMERIAKAAGYSKLVRSRRFANMVGYHLEPYSKLLSARFFCLLNEVSDQFPIFELENWMIFGKHF